MPCGEIARGEVRVGVVSGVGVAEIVHQRRVGRHDVVRLHERFLARLPVDPHDLLDVGDLDSPFERVGGEVIVEPGEMLGERSGVGVGVDEHETVPRVDSRLGQRVVGGGDAREVPLARDLLERAVEVPGPSVERAAQLLGAVAVRFTEPAAAVQAGVAEGLDAVGGAHDQERHVGDLVDVVVADVRDLLRETGELPHRLQSFSTSSAWNSGDAQYQAGTRVFPSRTPHRDWLGRRPTRGVRSALSSSVRLTPDERLVPVIVSVIGW